MLAIEEELTCDSGCVGNDVASGIGAAFMSSVYYCPNWLVRAMYAITNTASNTFTRAPGVGNHFVGYICLGICGTNSPFTI